MRRHSIRICDIGQDYYGVESSAKPDDGH